MLNFNKKIIVMIVLGTIFVPVAIFAATSTNYISSQDDVGPSQQMVATSSNYSIRMKAGEPVVGTATNTNYVVDFGGNWYSDLAGTVTIQWAVPESRVGAGSTNDDVIFYLTARSPGTNIPIFTSPIIASTSVDGTYNTPIDVSMLPDGVYDFTIKGHQHLTRKLTDVILNHGNTVLNFTQSANTSTDFGNVVLLAGDINGVATSVDTFGDDKVNSVDITAALAAFNLSDDDGNTIREDINQDTKVNSVDVTLVLNNFNQVGD